VDIKKLNQVINEIELTTSDVKKYNEAYKKIVEMNQNLEKLFDSIRNSSIEMNNFQSKILTYLNNGIANFENTEKELIEISKKNIKENSDLFKHTVLQVNALISKFDEDLKNSVNDFSGQIENKFNINSDKLNAINSELQKKMNEIFSVVLKDNKEKSLLIETIEKNTLESINSLILAVNNNTKSNLNLIKNLENIIEERFAEISRDNKNYYKDLDNSIFLRLDKHKSEISYENSENYKKMEKSIYNTEDKIISKNQNSINTINKKLNINTTTVIILLILNIVLLAKNFI